MLITKACPRCRGDLAHVSDVGDSYYSCVQCGHIVYRLYTAPARAEAASAERPRPVAVTRDEGHRRRIRRRLAERRHDSSAA